MPSRVEILAAALAEGEEATAWYAARSPRAAIGFAEELTAAIRRIGEAPQRWPVLAYGARRVPLRKYPDAVVYRDRRGFVLVVAIAHARRRFGYWRRR